MSKRLIAFVMAAVLILSLGLAGCSSDSGTKNNDSQTEETVAQTVKETETEAVSETEELAIGDGSEESDIDTSDWTEVQFQRITLEEYYEMLSQDPELKDVVLDGNTITYTEPDGTKCSMVEEELGPDVVQLTITEGDQVSVIVTDYANNTMTVDGEPVSATQYPSSEEEERPVTAYMDNPVWGDKLTELEKHVTMTVTNMSTEPIYATVLLEAGEFPDRLIARNSVTYDAIIFENGEPVLNVPLYYYNEETKLYDTVTWDEEKGEAASLSLEYSELAETCFINRKGSFLKYETSIIDPEGYGLQELMYEVYQYVPETKEIIGKRQVSVAYEAEIVEAVSNEDETFKPEGKVLVTANSFYGFDADPDETYTVIGTCVTNSTDGEYAVLNAEIMGEENER